MCSGERAGTKPCAPRAAGKKERENEERLSSWCRPTSFAQLQVASQSWFITNVVLVRRLKTAL